MPNAIIVGAQWGDEAKGKIVDYLTESADIVIRAQGGSNAGHTVINQGVKYILHLIPSGILWKGKICVIGNGVALDPISLGEEIRSLEKVGIEINPGNLLISERAHLTLPYHRHLDALRENSLGAKKIGTTKRGIGPTYCDKVMRTGLRMIDINDITAFADRLFEKMVECNDLLKTAGLEPIEVEETCRQAVEAAERLRPHMANTMSYLHGAIKSKKNLLFEAAQGTYLDVDYGTYPYVTSSNTISAGALTGSGVPPQRIDKVVGVCKAYTTRVGSGPLPTENQFLGDHLHGMGREFGATTGRERRCGWLDAVVLRQAVMVNGIDELAVTNLDGLDLLDSVQICTHYELDGVRLDLPPASVKDFERVTPVYEELPGWKEDISKVRDWNALPELAKSYLGRVETLLDVRITLLGVGPDRIQTIVRP